MIFQGSLPFNSGDMEVMIQSMLTPIVNPGKTIRKIIKDSLDQDVFESTIDIDMRPLFDHVQWHIANKYKPKERKVRTSEREHECVESNRLAANIKVSSIIKMRNEILF